MDNHASTAIRKEGILKLKELSGRDDKQFQILDFTSIGGGGGAGASGEAQAPKQKPQKEPKRGKVE